jgi:hypothetical protein
VSRAEDQDYGNLTFNTVGRIAGGLDMAFVGKFVPFSELVKFSLNLSEDEFEHIPQFETENAALGLGSINQELAKLELKQERNNSRGNLSYIPPQPHRLGSAFDELRRA